MKKRLIKILSAFLTCTALMSMPVISYASSNNTTEKTTQAVSSIHENKDTKNALKSETATMFTASAVTSPLV